MPWLTSGVGGASERILSVLGNWAWLCTLGASYLDQGKHRYLDPENDLLGSRMSMV
jgi:hypothetical protein